MNLQWVAKLFPQGEAAADDQISAEMKIVFGVLAGALTAHLSHAPAVQNILNIFHLTPDVFPALLGIAATYATAWVCAFLHVHVFNGTAQLPAAAKTATMLLACIGLVMLSGCGGDSRVAAAAQGVADRENNCIKNHMQIHATEQQAIIDANNKLIQQRQDLMTAQTIAAATANKAITPTQIVADLQRTNQEAQQFRDQVLTNIRNLQAQIITVNGDHDQAQQLLSAVITFENTPGPSLTQIATQTTNILTPVLKKTNSSATSSATSAPAPAIVPDAASGPAATTAAPVPGQ